MLSRQSKSRTNLRKNNRGVTLIEVIAVVAVMSIVMAAVTGFIITGSKMSANVSGHAKDSMQEQTAVEYINRWIWAADNIEFVEDPETNEFIEILIDGKSLKTKDGTVVFGTAAEDSWIKLCDGEITFERQVQEENVMDDVLVYILNGEKKHVVYLRAGKIVSEND